MHSIEPLEPRIAPATIFVTSLLDNGDGDKITLREAIDLANDAATHPGADTIAFKIPAEQSPGVIVLTAGTLGIRDALTIKGPGVDLLTISGNNASAIFFIQGGDPVTAKPVAISGLTLTEGKESSQGAAIASFEPLTLDHVVVRNNVSTQGSGGAVWVKTTGKVSIRNSVIADNTAYSEGGLFLQGAAGVSVIKTTIANNSAEHGVGGLSAIAKGARSAILVSGCVITHNSGGNDAAGSGGGGLALDGTSDGKMSVVNCLVTGNTAGSIAGGGGIKLLNGNLVVSKTNLSRNTAVNGGAIDASGGSLTISGSRFLDNETNGEGGGAVYSVGTSVKITGSLFSNNRSGGVGGALVAIGSTTTVSSSSFLGNDAERGGAICAAGSTVLAMTGCSLSGNAADDGGAIAAVSSAVLKLKGNQLTENQAARGGAIFLEDSVVNRFVVADLSGNLLQGNVARQEGGAIYSTQGSVLQSKADRIIGNVSYGQGGGLFLDNEGDNVITGSLLQGNVAAGSGGGLRIVGDAVLTGVKILDNIAGAQARGGGLRIGDGTVVIAKSVIMGNIANDGGGIFKDGAGTTTLDAATRAATTGNSARFFPNLEGV